MLDSMLEPGKKVAKKKPRCGAGKYKKKEQRADAAKQGKRGILE